MALAFRIFYNCFNENNIKEGGTKMAVSIAFLAGLLVYLLLKYFE